jgi:hypothetical protein
LELRGRPIGGSVGGSLTLDRHFCDHRSMSERETGGDGEAHDVLAAEAFGFPAADPELHHHGPVVLPEDPTGIEEPHDVLAAEEFPMPAARPPELMARMGRDRPWARVTFGLLGLALLLWLLRRR